MDINCYLVCNSSAMEEGKGSKIKAAIFGVAHLGHQNCIFALLDDGALKRTFAALIRCCFLMTAMRMTLMSPQLPGLHFMAQEVGCSVERCPALIYSTMFEQNRDA